VRSPADLRGAALLDKDAPFLFTSGPVGLRTPKFFNVCKSDAGGAGGRFCGLVGDENAEVSVFEGLVPHLDIFVRTLCVYIFYTTMRINVFC